MIIFMKFAKPGMEEQFESELLGLCEQTLALTKLNLT